MSLKTFHLVFIACSSALAFLFGAWALRNASSTAGIAAFAIGLGLVAYEAWFLRYSRGRR